MRTDMMRHRLRRLGRWPTLVAIVPALRGFVELFHLEEFLRTVFGTLTEFGVFRIAGSPTGLIVLSLAWLTLLIVWPDISNSFKPWALRGAEPKLRTWINESERHEVLNWRLAACKSGETVRFISFTGKSVLLPEDRPGEYLKDRPFPSAVSRGVVFHGVLLDPTSAEARFRSAIETPDTSEADRLLQDDSRQVSALPRRYEQASIPRHITEQRVQLKYVSIGLPFSLWLFHDVALMEPYHLGKRPGIGNLCEFAQMIIPSQDINYRIVEDHFMRLWREVPSKPVWSTAAVQNGNVVT